MANINYPKYQYSIFLNGDRNEQLVIRTETWKAFVAAKKKVNKILQKVEKKKEEEPERINNNKSYESHKCLIHNVNMTQRTGTDGRTWYSHGYKTKSGKTIWCSGQGWKNPNAAKTGSRYIEDPESVDSL